LKLPNPRKEKIQNQRKKNNKMHDLTKNMKVSILDGRRFKFKEEKEEQEQSNPNARRKKKMIQIQKRRRKSSIIQEINTT
jgi:hypothetical protein